MFAAKKQDYSVLHQVIKGMVEANKFTPDIAFLEEHEFQLIFVCDGLQRSLPHYNMIEEGAYLGTAFTTKNFQFFKSKTIPNATPVAMETNLSMDKFVPSMTRFMPPPAKIKGELHLILPHQFKQLDIELHNGVKFNRKRVRLIFPYREERRFPEHDVHRRPLPEVLLGKEGQTFLTKEKVHIIRAWMYVGNPQYWNDLLDVGYHFEAVRHFIPNGRTWLKRYYQYTKHEIK